MLRLFVLSDVELIGFRIGGGAYGRVEEVINPRRACAARVTVVGLSVCLSVCVSTLILALTRRPISDTSGFRTTGA